MPLVLRRYMTIRRLLAAAAISGGLAAAIASVIPSSSAKAQSVGCSVQSLKGNYLGNISGTSSATGPLAVQAQTTFNGDGTATANVVLMTQSTGPVAFTDTITYTLTSNCTGTLTAKRSTGETVHYAIALSKAGSKLNLLQTDTTNVVTGTLTLA